MSSEQGAVFMWATGCRPQKSRGAGSGPVMAHAFVRAPARQRISRQLPSTPVPHKLARAGFHLIKDGGHFDLKLAFG